MSLFNERCLKKVNKNANRGRWPGGGMSMMYNVVLGMSSVGIVVSYVTNDLCPRHVEVENIDF